MLPPHISTDMLRLLCTLVLLVPVTCTDPCLDAIDIGYPYRSTAYKTDTDYICDLYTIVDEGKWYRFRQYTGEQMAVYCPYFGYCSTQYPIWMNGSHPTVAGIITEATACVVKDTCCDFAKPMKVVLCEDGGDTFYSYQLPEVTGCSSAYCAGDKMPCLPGEDWEGDKCVIRRVSTSIPTTVSPVVTARTVSTSVPTTVSPHVTEVSSHKAVTQPVTPSSRPFTANVDTTTSPLKIVSEGMTPAPMGPTIWDTPLPGQMTIKLYSVVLALGCLVALGTAVTIVVINVLCRLKVREAEYRKSINLQPRIEKSNEWEA